MIFDRYTIAFFLVLCFSGNAIGQINIPIDTTCRIDSGWFNLNGKEGREILYKEKSKNIHSIESVDHIIRSFTSSTKEEGKLNIVFDKKGRVTAVFKVTNDSVEGPMLLFHKGTLELILVYKKSVLVNTLYYRNKGVLNNYIKKNGRNSPYTFSTTIEYLPSL